MTVEVIALSGGVGGAKLAHGLYRLLPENALGVLVNTGDDFVHLGLPISPDIDTVLYTLSGLADTERGWGRAHESWAFIDAIAALGGPNWFQLGDRDLALHVMRRSLLDAGCSLSEAIAQLTTAAGVRARIWPMSDQAVSTIVATPEGELPFQEYFVQLRCAPVIRALRFEGAALARSPEGLEDALSSPALRAIVICPSNPWLSIDPILAIPGLPAKLRDARVPVVAVSPLVGGRAVKGPTAKIMAELNIPLTHASIAKHYAGLIDGLVVHEGDDTLGVAVPMHVVSTLMTSEQDRERLARETLAFAMELAK